MSPVKRLKFRLSASNGISDPRKGDTVRATIQNLKLELIEHNHKNKTAKIGVEYITKLSAVEGDMAGLRFKEKVQIWGADSRDPDDFLYEFSTTIFPKETDRHVMRSRTVTVGDEILDEDGWWRPTDEIYAKVWVTPLLPSGDYEKSNEVHHKF